MNFMGMVKFTMMSLGNLKKDLITQTLICWEITGCTIKEICAGIPNKGAGKSI